MLWKGFQKPKRLAADTETLTDKYGRFWAQPFERGFGTTIGNALRRVLLSSIEGAAVTAVKIEGVLHEFQSIPGVVEDATDIILNLKQVPFKLNGEGPKAIYLKVEQPGVVTSGMIEADADVEILDKDMYIATVSEGGRLEMEMRLKRGRGYVSADKNFEEDLGIGFIPIDSVHSPVRKCNYTVEAARLGQITDYDKLTLEVWTNGSITPADSIGLAAKLLKDHMNIFINFEEDIETSTSTEDRIETTVTKAKALRPQVEKMITLGKRGDLSARRQAGAYLMTKEAVNKLFDTVAPRFGDREGGYLRIVRAGWKKGDGADKAFVELLGSEKLQEEKREKRA